MTKAKEQPVEGAPVSDLAPFVPVAKYAVPEPMHVDTCNRFGERIAFDFPAELVEPRSEDEEDALEALVHAGIAQRQEGA